MAVIEVNPLYLRRWHLAREEAEVAVRPVTTVLIPSTPTDHLDGRVGLRRRQRTPGQDGVSAIETARVRPPASAWIDGAIYSQRASTISAQVSVTRLAKGQLDQEAHGRRRQIVQRSDVPDHCPNTQMESDERSSALRQDEGRTRRENGHAPIRRINFLFIRKPAAAPENPRPSRRTSTSCLGFRLGLRLHVLRTGASCRLTHGGFCRPTPGQGDQRAKPKVLRRGVVCPLRMAAAALLRDRACAILSSAARSGSRKTAQLGVLLQPLPEGGVPRVLPASLSKTLSLQDQRVQIGHAAQRSAMHCACRCSAASWISKRLRQSAQIKERDAWHHLERSRCSATITRQPDQRLRVARFRPRRRRTGSSENCGVAGGRIDGRDERSPGPAETWGSRLQRVRKPSILAYATDAI